MENSKNIEAVRELFAISEILEIMGAAAVAGIGPAATVSFGYLAARVEVCAIELEEPIATACRPAA